LISSLPGLDPTGQILELDYASLGLKCGIEVHYQLATRQKLFCHCPVGLYSERVDAEVLRHMRPTPSEMGEYDPCALMEYKTRKEIIYLLNKESACTYETDDTPPFPINREAVDFATEVAMLFDCTIVDELHIARKQYLDGSIPTGFQRTALLAVDGKLPYRGREIAIHQVTLEEDACREVADRGHMIWFRTDRLGIPIVEIITQPQLRHPFEAAEVSRLIARTLQLSGKVRRGIGSVRQDLNISIHGGSRVEIKGVPRIAMIPRLVSYEVYRQMKLLEIRDWLRRRNITDSSVVHQTIELPGSRIRFQTRQLAEAHAQGQRVTALRISGIEKLMNMPVQPGRTFAHEISGRVRVIACLDDIPNFFHAEEDGEFACHPADRSGLLAITNADSGDAVTVFHGLPNDVATAIEETLTRIREATNGVPAETRQFLRSGCTDFERLLAGPHQMYPDTDSPPIVIDRAKLRHIATHLPPRPWERREKLLQLGLSESTADQLTLSPYHDLFWLIHAAGGIPANRIARVLLQDIAAARRAGGHPERVKDDAWLELFDHLKTNRIFWEAARQLVRLRSRKPGVDWMDLAARNNLLPLAEHEWQAMASSLIQMAPSGKEPETRLRWIIGRLQRPPGRIPAAEAVRFVRARLSRAPLP
jgi:glutamyl-tRNA(Gln) amidotransferase subunit E